MLEIISIIILVAIDQITKILTVKYLAIPNVSVNVIDGIFELTYVENTGAAFGMFSGATILLSIVVVIVIGVVIYFKSRLPITAKYRPLHILSLFIIAGAIGNLIDRIRLKYVVDMFHFYWFEFPVFNVADIYVTCSAILLMILMVTKYRDLEL